MKTSYYAIEIIGYGKNRRYVVKEVVRDGKFGPVTTWPCEPPFRTEEAARKAAAESGIEIAKVGDCYQII